MPISAKQLIGLPVVTKSGIKLGRIVNCLVDTDSQSILQYTVKEGLVAGRKILLINRSQVFSIDFDKMVVDDAVGEEKISEAVVALKPV
jgi:sporulation protein YlmC with PRC-barrel domain